MNRFGGYNVSKVSGVIGGVLAFAVGFLLVRHMVLLGPTPESAYEAGNTTVSGWFYYNAQMVPLTERASIFGETMSASGYDLITDESTSNYLEFLYLIPPFVLILFGALTAASYGKTRTPIFAALNGASIAFGYLPAVIAGVFLFSATDVSFGVRGTLRPDVWQSLIIAGVVYPGIFGGIGGLAYFLSQGSIRIHIS